MQTQIKKLKKTDEDSAIHLLNTDNAIEEKIENHTYFYYLVEDYYTDNIEIIAVPAAVWYGDDVARSGQTELYAYTSGGGIFRQACERCDQILAQIEERHVKLL